MAEKKIYTFRDILNNLKKGEIEKLYVLYGEEDFLKEKLVRAIEQLIIDPLSKDVDYVVYDFQFRSENIDLDRIAREIKTPPFLSKKKMILVKHSELFCHKKTSRKTNSLQAAQNQKSDHDKEKNGFAMVDLLRLCNETSCLVFWEDQVDKRSKQLIEEINTNGILGEIQQPDIRTTRSWVASEFKKVNINISPEGCDQLIDRHDSDLQRIYHEINKLILCAQYYGKNQIDVEDVDHVCLSDLKGNVFHLVDALSGNNPDEAFQILESLILQKQPIPLIYHMITRNIRQLILAKDSGNVRDILSAIKVIPFVANKLYSQSKKFSFDALEDIYSQSVELENNVKSSKIPERIALEILCAYILSCTHTERIRSS
jgi:DNA polymerase III subunit delta